MANLSESTKLYVKLERLTVALEERNKHIDRLFETVYGGNDGNGLVTKVDRIEQSNERSKWMQRAISIPVIGLIIQWLINHIKH